MEDVTWSVFHGGGWSKFSTHSPARYAVRFAPSSTIIFAPCHILLTFTIVAIVVVALNFVSATETLELVDFRAPEVNCHLVTV